MWLSHIRSDDLFEVSYFTQVPAQRFKKERRYIIKMTKRSVKHVKYHRVSNSFLKHDLYTLRVIRYSDVLFSSN